MKNIKKENATSGITLISLVVTIMVLLILTGVSISTIIKEDGLISQASTAVIKTEETNALQEVSDAWAKVASEYYGTWSNKTKAEYFTKDNLNKYLEKTGNITELIYNANGESLIRYQSISDSIEYEIRIDDQGNARIPAIGEAPPEIGGDTSEEGDTGSGGDTSEGGDTSSGDTSSGENEETTNSNLQGKFIESENKTIIGDTNGTYKNPLIPVGFKTTNEGGSWAVNGEEVVGWNDGLVIEDTKGNQFVWVPVDGKNVIYEKWDATLINPDLVIPTTTNDTLPVGIDSETTQITKNGGFWLGRFEAGRSDLDVVSGETNNKTTGIELLIKKGSQPWNYIGYPAAKVVSENFISNEYVQSGLVTGTQWCTVADWIRDAGKNVAIDSSSWGTFYSTTGIKIVGRYSINEFSTESTSASAPTIWRTANNDSPYNKTTDSILLTGSGLNSKSQAKNIYDLAGNVWEWTTDVYVRPSGQECRLMRGAHGGSGTISQPSSMLSYWEGFAADGADGSTSPTMWSLGFRVVLYLK